MASEQSVEMARRAQEIHEHRLKGELEATHRDDFVAVEPESGDYFLGKTLSEAIQAARAAYPERLPFALRVGHKTTVYLRSMLFTGSRRCPSISTAAWDCSRMT